MPHLNFNYKLKFKTGIVAGAIVLSLLSLAFVEDMFQVTKNLDLFASVYKEISINYVDEVDPSKVIKTGIDAMLEDLDPYTQYIQESDVVDYKLKYVSTQYGGIGASIFTRDGKLYISEPFEGFPAQKADIRPGDEILEINSIKVKGKSNEQVSQMLKGPKNSTVKLLINRPEVANPIEKPLIREDIKQDNVSYYGMLPENVGYIKLDRFLEDSSQEVKQALLELRKNKLNGLILDLRNNGGGILQDAVKIVNLFVNKDVNVVIQKNRYKDRTITYKTSSNPIEAELPLIVLINSRSASASEIVAGSLQDLDRAIIVGQRSFGKGLVQQTFNLPYNSLMKVTVAKYYTPSGRCIQALDYTHRDSEGSVVKVADSLISEYKTKRGRLVYDGSGIYPDVFVKPLKYNQITQTLANKYFVFDYATKFRKEKQSIGDAKSFNISDSEYLNFVDFLSNKDYNYNTKTEKLLSDLRDEAEKENKLGEIKTEYEALKAKVFYSKKNDLIQFKDEIRKVLEAEITSRYYFERGRIEQGFKYDTEISKALTVIGDKSTIASILKGEGTFKTIGKPGEDFSANAPK